MQIKNRDDENPNSILFVTSQLRQREIKIAYALKTQGWSVGLLYYNTTPFKPDDHFDFASEVHSPHQAHKIAIKLRPRAIHVFSGAIDDYILLFCRDKVAPTIIDLNDIFTPSLMDYCPERYVPTKEALALADGLCTRDLQIKCAEKLDRYKIPENLLFFPEYCWNKNEDKAVKKYPADEIHLVSVGTISLETHGMYDCCYVELVKMLLEQQIHFHIYPPWHYREDHAQFSSVNFERDYAQFIELEKNSPYLHIHSSLPVEELARVLPKYDFGIISGGCEAFGQRYTHFKPEYVEACYSGRIADYLDAGLAVVINKEVTFDYWFLQRYGVCIDLKGILQSGFKEKLQALKQSAHIKQQVEDARRILSIEENAERLTRFYTSIIESIKFHPGRYYYQVIKDVLSIVPRAVRKIGRNLDVSIRFLVNIVPKWIREVGRYLAGSS